MSFQTIEKLLQKYFEGETSLQEEVQLRKFFRQDEVPPHLMSLKEIFVACSSEKEMNPLGEGFDQEIMSRIASEKVVCIRRKRRNYIYMFAGVAATILVIIGSMLYLNVFTKSIEDTFNDPQIAYNEAKKVMLYISGKLNKGTQPLSSAAEKIDKGVQTLKPVEKFNAGIEETSKIEKFNRIQLILSNAVIP